MTSSPLPERAGARRGIAMLCAAAVMFACLDTIAKYLVASLPVLEVAWARYMSSWILVVVLFSPRMGWRLWRTRRLGVQLVRGALLTASTFLFISSLAHLPLAEMSALALVTPLLVALLSGPLLGERVGTVLWLGIVGGFVGALIVLRPGGGVFHWASLLPLGAAASFGLYQILTRKISGDEHPVTSLFYASLVGALALSLTLPWVWRTPPDPGAAGLLALLGVFAGSGHFLVIKAFEAATPSLLGPYSYTQIVWTITLGYLVFGDFPDPITLVGIAVIVAAAIGVGFAGTRGR